MDFLSGLFLFLLLSFLSFHSIVLYAREFPCFTMAGLYRQVWCGVVHALMYMLPQ